MATNKKPRRFRDTVKAVRIMNKDLDCKDCKYRRDDSIIYGNVSRCDVYPNEKPRSVMSGEKCRDKEVGAENDF